MNNLNYSSLMSVMIAINIGLGLYLAGLKPAAIPSFMAVSFMFFMFLHSFRK